MLSAGSMKLYISTQNADIGLNRKYITYYAHLKSIYLPFSFTVWSTCRLAISHTLTDSSSELEIKLWLNRPTATPVIGLLHIERHAIWESCTGAQLLPSTSCLSCALHTQDYAYLGGKVHVFPALLANIHGKSMIFACQMTLKLCNALCRPTPLCVMIACAMCALTGVTNIEFLVVHVALPNASTAQRRRDILWSTCGMWVSFSFITPHVAGV